MTCCCIKACVPTTRLISPRSISGSSSRTNRPFTAPVSPGLFLDLREGRRLCEQWAKGKTVCNLFSFTGAFGVGAMVHTRYQTLLNRIWDDVAVSTVSNGGDYYGATLRMAYLLAMSGNFWRP